MWRYPAVECSDDLQFDNVSGAGNSFTLSDNGGNALLTITQSGHDHTIEFVGLGHNNSDLIDDINTAAGAVVV